MVNFVALFESSQNRNRVLNTWFADVHLLESSLKGRIFFNILAIFIKSGCTNHAQFTTSQHRFNHVAGVHGTFGTTSTDDGVQLINERDHFTGGIGDFFEYCFEAFFEFAAIFCTSHQACNIK